jgi:hypothetical protein
MMGDAAMGVMAMRVMANGNHEVLSVLESSVPGQVGAGR